MPFDGITINSLKKEIKEILIDSKIDKIHQPEPDEIIFIIRKNRKNYKLLLSADSNLPHFTLTESKKENPIAPPMFCMLLRKHLTSGRILDIEQLGLERVIIISVESKDELGNKEVKRIIFEIMGKHSNITLVNTEDKIIDCIKRIPLGVNRYRQLFPGITYLYPPNEKKDPRDINDNAFREDLKLSDTMPIFKHIYSVYQGISPIIAKELCLKIGLNFNTDTTELTEENIKLLSDIFISFFKSHEVFNNVVYNKNKSLKDLSVIHLSNYENDKFIIKEFDTTSEVVNEYYGNINTVNKLLQRSHDLRKSIRGKIKKLNKKVKNLESDLLYADSAETNKINGDLILANLYRIDKRMDKITVENFYDNNNKIEIILNTFKTPSENAQEYFKKYNKLKTAQIKVREQLEKALHEISYLEQVEVNVEQSPDQQNIEDIKEELVQSGYLKKKHSKHKKKRSKSKPIEYISSDGFEILVGKNNLQNDELTLKTASKSDTWLHTKIIPGSHVIIRAYGEDIPDNTIIEAAMIAAYHSKAKDSSKVPVDYTDVRNVKKPNGAKPGMVIYSTNNTIYTTPDVEKIEKLKKT